MAGNNSDEGQVISRVCCPDRFASFRVSEGGGGKDVVLGWGGGDSAVIVDTVDGGGHGCDLVG